MKRSRCATTTYGRLRPWWQGYVVDGGWIKTWYEHMLEIERRRLTLAGHGASQLNTLMKRVEEFYSGYLLDRLPPREIFARRPEFNSFRGKVTAVR